MSDHINSEIESRVPDYARHGDAMVCGFFGEYRFLSNFWPCRVGVWWMGNMFPSVENAYQAAKFPKQYHKEFVDVSVAMSKKLAKAMVKEDPEVFNKENWQMIKRCVMANLVFQKFSFDADLQQCLLDTEDRYLEETNSWHDYYWGVCDGQGQNNLGKILMRTRSFWKAI